MNWPRYLNDAVFHAMVESFLAGVRGGTYTLADLRQAVALAERIHEERAAMYPERYKR